MLIIYNNTVFKKCNKTFIAEETNNQCLESSTNTNTAVADNCKNLQKNNENTKKSKLNIGKCYNEWTINERIKIFAEITFSNT